MSCDGDGDGGGGDVNDQARAVTKSTWEKASTVEGGGFTWEVGVNVSCEVWEVPVNEVSVWEWDVSATGAESCVMLGVVESWIRQKAGVEGQGPEGRATVNEIRARCAYDM